MKRALVWFIFAVTFLSSGAAQRLPDLAAPENYKLTIQPDFSHDKFSGEEAIQIRVLKPTSEIVLNSADIEIHDASIQAAGLIQKAKVTPQKKKEMVTLAVEKPLPPGAAIVFIRFTGIFNSELRGLYMGRAWDRKYAVTQFEATDARRMFPCFDEPAYKATFDLTAIADQAQSVISNGRIISDEPGPAEGKHTVHFATTPKMSSYLVALAIGEFEHIDGEADGIPIHVWTTAGKKDQGRFGLEAAERCMRFYNHYFSIKYPFEKLDLIEVPDFAAGAMENTAAIIFRDSDLLVDPEQSSVDQQKNVAATVGHEIAHQWFGDLVTMAWWDDLWLNEGFANWMQNKPIAEWKPEWNLDLEEIQDSNRALKVDSLASTHPIHQPGETPDQINELFDTIAYDKAAAVLQMVENYVGPEGFRAGVNEYLKRYAYGNATSSDFWNTMAAVSRKPVDQIMASFVKQAGAPMVGVNTECSGNTTSVTLTQQRYFNDRTRFDTGSDAVWAIPVCIRAGGNSEEKAAGRCDLLTDRQAKLTLSGCARWVLANAGTTGYYRSSYEPIAIREMSRFLENDFTPGERVRLLSDEWASVQVGRQTIADYLGLAGGLQSERNRAVVDELSDQLEYIGKYLVTNTDRESYQAWVRALLNPAARELGWKAVPNESDDRRALRALVWLTLGRVGHDPQVLAEAGRLAKQALDNPSAVDATLAPTVFVLAAQNGGSSLYDQIMDRMRKTASPEEYYMLLDTLSRFSDPRLLVRTLRFALTPEVRSHDVPGLIAGVMENPAGQRLAWDFVRAHWPEIAKAVGEFDSEIVVKSTSSFCEPGLSDELKEFFASHEVPAAERALRQTIEQVNDCVDLKSQQAAHLAAWLENNGASAGK